MALAPVYRPLSSPLHATRAGISALWIASLMLATLLLESPIALGGIAMGAIAAAIAAGVGRQIKAALRFALLLSVPIVLIDVLINRHGLTVFARIGDLGPFGQGDLTVEALVYACVVALQVSTLILLGALGSLCVDPDELIAICGRLSFRSALTAAVALRMVPLLATDAQRFAEAQRTRPARARRQPRATIPRLSDAVRGRGRASERPRRERRRWGRAAIEGRTLLIWATMGSALDRAMDVTATLELRGLATSKPAPRLPRPLSRHDIAFLCSTAAVGALALIGAVAGVASFDAFPLLRMQAGPATVCLSGALVIAALAPLLDRRGIDP